MEIYTLNIAFPYDEEEEPWSKTIEVEENFSLLKLHEYIQEIVEFDNDHMFGFYVGRNPRNEAYTLSKGTQLNEVYPLKGQKLYYLFDYGDSWLFEIKKSRKKKAKDHNKYPVVVDSTGVNPEQYPEYEEYDDS